METLTPLDRHLLPQLMKNNVLANHFEDKDLQRKIRIQKFTKLAHLLQNQPSNVSNCWRGSPHFRSTRNSSIINLESPSSKKLRESPARKMSNENLQQPSPKRKVFENKDEEQDMRKSTMKATASQTWKRNSMISIESTTLLADRSIMDLQSEIDQAKSHKKVKARKQQTQQFQKILSNATEVTKQHKINLKSLSP